MFVNWYLTEIYVPFTFALRNQQYVSIPDILIQRIYDYII